ncbi:MAG TPA: hypothetical protein VIS07_15485 [Candidatus Binatia bacterium]
MGLAEQVASEEASREAAPFPWLLFAALGLALIAIAPDASTNPFDGPMIVAERMLRGASDLPPEFGWMETFRHRGKTYLAYPPMVTFILVPYAALGGAALGQTVANSLLIFGSAILLYLLMRNTPGLERLAAVGALVWVVGTPLLYSAHFGTVWMLMHSEGNFFLLLALYLAAVRRSFFWAGCAFMVASLTRYAILFSAPAFVVLAVDGRLAREQRGAALRDLLRFALGAAILAAGTLLYNWWLFDAPLKSPYVTSWRQKSGHWVRADKSLGATVFAIGSFRPSNVPQNVAFYLTARPVRVPWFPYVRFSGGGEAIWLLSPFFLGLLLPRLRLRATRWLVAGALPMLLFYLLYSYQGYVQYGSRYLSDVFPFLVPLALSAFARASVWWRRALVVLVALSIAANAYGVWVVSTFGIGLPRSWTQRPAERSGTNAPAARSWKKPPTTRSWKKPPAARAPKKPAAAPRAAPAKPRSAPPPAAAASARATR